MENKECFALKSNLGILKFLVSESAYIAKLKPFISQSTVKRVNKNKACQLVCGNKKTPLLNQKVCELNGYYLISPTGSYLSYFVDGDLDPVFRKEIVIDERSLAEAIVASPASVKKYVPASKILRIKSETTYALFNQSSNNPNIAANLDIIDEFLTNNENSTTLKLAAEN